MHTLRRIFVLPTRNTLATIRTSKAIALLLVIIIPGGLMLPICYGLYGAIRHTLSNKASPRTAGSQDVAHPVNDAQAPR